MKILFLEVRSKTKLFHELAKEIKKSRQDVEVHWIIQNRAFRLKKEKNIHTLKYPKIRELLRKNRDSVDIKVSECDRFSLHFNSENWYYTDYRKQLEALFDKIKPDFVFGELGNFFTHYSALISKERKIPFYDIETARFPTGSIGFYQYDEWNPLKLKDVTDQEAENFLLDFQRKKPVPDYMKKPTSTKKDLLRLRTLQILHKLRVLSGYVTGETYCTQNPITNIFEKRQVKEKVKLWEKYAKTLKEVTEQKHKKLLFPLQMQPEFNLEVWGHPYNNQEKIILKIAEKLPSDWKLIIKINPKSYFELNRLNLGKILENKNIILLERPVDMKTLDKYIDIVATVTGTVQIERILTNKPVYIIGNTPFKKYSCIDSSIESLTPEDFYGALNKKLQYSQLLEVSKFLLEYSTAGLMGEPINSIECMKKENIAKISQACIKVLEMGSITT